MVARPEGIESRPGRLPRWCQVRLVRDRNAEPGRAQGGTIRGPADILALLGPELSQAPTERFVVVCLNVRAGVIATVTVTAGLLDSTLVHPREVFRPAILAGAAGVILVHNHPSGDPTPSPEDRAITRQLVAAGRVLDIPVYDACILGGGRCVSLAEMGLL